MTKNYIIRFFKQIKFTMFDSSVVVYIENRPSGELTLIWWTRTGPLVRRKIAARGSREINRLTRTLYSSWSWRFEILPRISEVSRKRRLEKRRERGKQNKHCDLGVIMCTTRRSRRSIHSAFNFRSHVTKTVDTSSSSSSSLLLRRLVQ